MVAGNVICFQTKSRTQGGMAFAGGMAGVDPTELPTTMPDGVTPLQGMSYVMGPDNRTTMHRTWVCDDPYGWAMDAPEGDLHPSDEEAGGYDLRVARDRVLKLVSDDDPEPEKSPLAGMTGEEVIAGMLHVAGGTVQDQRRALILAAIGEGPASTADIMAASARWPDDIPASSKTIGNELRAMVEEGILLQPGGKQTPYMPVPRRAA
ncbi:hypothetical protein [Pseudonocardia sp. T1-2H]|uniref:hypothetical protein n=1 Tax=Pseudonocardia sp. T1-2H TaxID=3128899 RepID=UPI0031017DE5